MKLFFSSGTCSLSPHIVLNEAGFDFTTERVDLKRHATASGQALASVHGKDYVPILELDDGQRLTEGPVIVQYLADLKPQAGLIPPVGSMERYRVLEWLNYTTSELHKTFYPLFHPELPVDDWRQHARDKVSRTFEWVSSQLGQQEYVTGARFTVADAYLFTVVNWANFVSVDLNRWPTLTRYLARVAARPAVAKTLQAEGVTVKQAV
jgi:glutathione S-transferase